MSGTRPNPTASRRALAARLRRMRLAAGKSTDDAARELMASASKISRLESGERAPQPRDVRDLARYYGGTDDEIEQLQELVSEARRKGWWADYSTQDEQLELYLGLETAASVVEVFESLRWPGLLQTEDVSRVILENLRPAGEFSRDFIKEQIIIRQERQQRLLSGELKLHAILDEAIFHRPIGDRLIAQQIGHTLDLAEGLSNVIVQVVPFAAGIYPGLDGTFNVLCYPEAAGLDDMVFVEGLRGNMLIERPGMVARYRGIFRSTASDDALGADESVAWMKRFVERTEGGPGVF